MEMFPTCSLLASSPVIIMLLLWYSESVFFCVVVFPSATFIVYLFSSYLPLSISHFHFLKEAALIEALDIFMLYFPSISVLHSFSCGGQKEANVLKFTLFRHECCGQNTPGICRH